MKKPDSNGEAETAETADRKKSESKGELREGDSTLDVISALDGSDSDKDTDDDVDDLELADAIVDYTQAAAASLDPASDSSEDERPNKNTVGNIPYKEWYKDEEHVGYDVEGRKLLKSGRKDALDKLLARNDSSKEWRTVYDEYNDEEIVLSKEEMRMIRRIREGKFAHVEIDPFEPENDWFSRDQEVMPLSGAPEPKRRFIVSKWEEKKVVKLVRAMRKGWLKRTAPEEQPTVYLMWQSDGRITPDDASTNKTATGLTYIPAPKLKLPGHEESYNPPPEYVPTEEERNAALLQAEENGDRAPFLPKMFDALRKVPAYESFIHERFERCLDLYLCPRTRTRRLRVDNPEDLVPKLPSPKDLQPFPTTLAHRFLGHTGAVRSVSPDGTGQWLATGSADGTARVWEVATGRCIKVWQFQDPVSCVSWCPNPKLELLAAAVGNNVLLLAPDVGNTGTTKGSIFGNNPRAIATRTALQAALDAALTDNNTQSGSEEKETKGSNTLVSWKRYNKEGLKTDDVNGLQGLTLEHRFPVKHVTWHARGDYFATVAPTGNTKAVLVHQLSKGQSQNPFRKNRGRVVRTLFHPSKPFFFVATQQAVRVYNLAKQSLAKKLIGGSGVITSMAIHSSGDHLLVGAEDRRVCWYDLDLSSTPYKALKYHEHAVRGTAYHRSYPLFASSSDDGTVHIFHGMVYSDLMTNPLIVPVKILRGHKRVDAAGVLDVAFHPTQPWVFTAGADGNVCLYVNP